MSDAIQNEPEPSAIPVTRFLYRDVEKAERQSTGCMDACLLLQDCSKCTCGLGNFCSCLCCLLVMCSIIILVVIALRCSKLGLDACMRDPL